MMERSQFSDNLDALIGDDPGREYQNTDRFALSPLPGCQDDSDHSQSQKTEPFEWTGNALSLPDSQKTEPFQSDGNDFSITTGLLSSPPAAEAEAEASTGGDPIAATVHHGDSHGYYPLDDGTLEWVNIVNPDPPRSLKSSQQSSACPQNSQDSEYADEVSEGHDQNRDSDHAGPHEESYPGDGNGNDNDNGDDHSRGEDDAAEDAGEDGGDDNGNGDYVGEGNDEEEEYDEDEPLEDDEFDEDDNECSTQQRKSPSPIKYMRFNRRWLFRDAKKEDDHHVDYSSYDASSRVSPPKQIAPEKENILKDVRSEGKPKWQPSPSKRTSPVKPPPVRRSPVRRSPVKRRPSSPPSPEPRRSHRVAQLRPADQTPKSVRRSSRGKRQRGKKRRQPIDDNASDGDVKEEARVKRPRIRAPLPPVQPLRQSERLQQRKRNAATHQH